jgi:Fic family protein
MSIFEQIDLEKLNQLPILSEITTLKNIVDSRRPLSIEVEQKILQKLRFDWTYHSNAIEGNTLTYGETVTLLMEGLTAKGKPLKDHLDIRGHHEVVNFLLEIVKEKREISEVDIRNLHKEMLVENYYADATTPDGKPTTKLIKIGEYKTTPNHVRTKIGEIHHYVSPDEVPARMKKLIDWYREMKQSADIHPVVLATLFHYEFVAVHPFADGNGRMSRWLMNLVLLQLQYPITVLKLERRNLYYAALRKADVGEYTDFIEFVAEAVLESLQVYEKAIYFPTKDS